MEDKLKFMAIESFSHIEISRLKSERLKLEGIPKPAAVSLFGESIEAEKQALQAEIDQILTSIVQIAARDFCDSFSPELLLERAKQVYRKEAPRLAAPCLMLANIEEFRKALEHEAYSRDVGSWDNRFSEIDTQIRAWTAKTPAPFNPAMINVETMGKYIPESKALRFPADRVGMADGKYCDLWLASSLKSKPITFDPPDRYIEKLIEYYNTVYVPMVERENREANKQAVGQEKVIEAAQAQPQPVDGYSIPLDELEAFREDRNFQGDGLSKLRGRR